MIKPGAGRTGPPLCVSSAGVGTLAIAPEALLGHALWRYRPTSQPLPSRRRL